MGWTNGWKFDVCNESHLRSFSQFIEFVRNELGDGRIVMQRARRLPPQDPNGNPSFQDLELYAGEHVLVTLRLRTDNLYVVGFRNTHGRWFRFAGGDAIPGIDSVELPVNGSYVGGNGIGPLEDVNLSTHAIETAIHGLARYGGGHQVHLSTWLRTLIVSFIEASRFTQIAGIVAAVMRGREEVLGGHNIGQIRNWGSLSTDLVETANDVVQQENLFLAHTIACGISTAYEAAAALGLVLITMAIAMSNAGDYQDVALGTTVLEVLLVVILDIDGEDPGDLYGTVQVHDSFGTKTLFHRERSHIQSVRSGDKAELVWPDRAISAVDDLVIDLDLMDRDRDMSWDDKVSLGEVVWISRQAERTNVEMSVVVPGKYGSVEVFYTVLTNAVVAIVEVLLIDGDGEKVPDVYGIITAKTKMAHGRSLKYDLFRHARSDQISVPANTNIPLQRRVITAVLGSPLTLKFNLWDKDSAPDISPDDQIAVGSLDFDPQFEGFYAQEITGRYGKVEARVTWSVSHF